MTTTKAKPGRGVRQNPQIHMDDSIINDPELAAQLETWAKRNRSATAVAAEARTQKKLALAMLTKHELGEGEYRCGGVVITIKKRDSRRVEFTIQDAMQTLFKDMGAE